MSTAEHPMHGHSFVEDKDSKLLPASKDGKQPGRVNVIFRGLFLFVERDLCIEVLVPNMGATHVYRAGNFLCETTLARRSSKQPYMLGGVVVGNAGFDKNEAVVFEGLNYAENLSMEDVYARILLPRPLKLLSLRKMTKPFESRIDPLGLFHDKQFPRMHIFVYETSDMSKVHFFPHERAGVGIQPEEQLRNLHIISEPETEYETENGDRNHVIAAAEKTIGLIEGLQGAVSITSAAAAEPPSSELGAMLKEFGIAAIETRSLRELNRALLKAGQSWIKGEPMSPSRGGEMVGARQLCAPIVLRSSR